MVAIHTKYIGPSNVRGSRYKAWTTKDRKTVTLSTDDALSDEENHNRVAVAYCRMMNWDGKLISGGTDEGYVYVFLPIDLTLAHRGRTAGSVIELPPAKKIDYKSMDEACAEVERLRAEGRYK